MSARKLIEPLAENRDEETSSRPEGKRAKAYGELLPLIKLCREGRIAEVQRAIEQGAAIDRPTKVLESWVKPSPLQTAINYGNCDITKVLLVAGAANNEERPIRPITLALRHKRFEIVKLLLDSGLKASQVDMCEVMRTQRIDIIEYFLERGGDIFRKNALARVLCAIKPAVAEFFLKQAESNPAIAEQFDMALRGLAWIKAPPAYMQKLIYKGLDPWKEGLAYFRPSIVKERGELYERIECSIMWAAINFHRWSFVKHPQIRKHLNNYGILEVAAHFCGPKERKLFWAAIDSGIPLNDLPSGGTSTIGNCIHHMWTNLSSERDDLLRFIHEIFRRGGKWIPDSWQIRHFHKAFTEWCREKYPPISIEYLVEFVCLAKAHGAASDKDLQKLLSGIRQDRLDRHQTKLLRILFSGGVKGWPHLKTHTYVLAE